MNHNYDLTHYFKKQKISEQQSLQQKNLDNDQINSLSTDFTRNGFLNSLSDNSMFTPFKSSTKFNENDQKSSIQKKINFMNFNEDIQYNLNFDNSNEIEPVIKEFDNKKKLINSTLDKWVLKKERPDTWPYLPKELIYKIYSYLTICDCANASLVCSFWKLCYYNIYFSYSFLNDFDSDRYTERELKTVFKKAGSQMKHIKKIEQILKGQKIGPLMKKTRLTAKLSLNAERSGSMFETFRLETKRAGMSSSVFLTDRALLSICNESRESLQYISLVSCQFVTGLGFEGLRKCENLQLLNIQNNSHIQDKNVEFILGATCNLKTLLLVKCSNLTESILSVIGKKCPKLQRLDLGNNHISFEQIHHLKNITTLVSVSFRYTTITNNQVEYFLRVCPQVHSLNLKGIILQCNPKGCSLLNNDSLLVIGKQGLNIKRLNISCINGIEEQHLYEMLCQCKILQVLMVNNNLISNRIEEILRKRSFD